MSNSERGYHALEQDEWELGQHDNGLSHSPVPKKVVKKSSWRTKVVTGVLILSNISTLIMLKRNAADQLSNLGQPGTF